MGGEAANSRPFGLSASVLKTIAILAMVIDHAAGVFVASYYSNLGILLHFVGRVTGPVMFFFAAEGYHQTKNLGRYMGRMALFTLFSYLPFIYLETGGLPTLENFLDLNVMFTLLAGLGALWALHHVRPAPAKWAVILGLLLVSELGDWGYTAVLMILMFDLFRGRFRHQALGYTAIVLLRILPVGVRVAGALLEGVPAAMQRGSIGYVLVELGMFLPLVLLWFYNGKRGGMNKWFFYIFYPAHMLVLGFLGQAFPGIRF